MSNGDQMDWSEIIDEAKEWDRRYLDGVVHSLELYEDPHDLQKVIHEFLSYKNRGAFKLTNPHSKRLWMAELILSFLALKRGESGESWDEALESRSVACALVTFTHDEWACADNNIQFGLGRAKQMVRNALNGVDFIAHFEAAPYRNEEWVTDGVVGKLISFHCHAIAWASSRSVLDRLRKRINPRFIPLLGNRSGVQFKKLDSEQDLITALAYISKMPTLGYRTFKKRNGKIGQAKSKISFKSRHHLFTALKKYDLFKFWLSGGDGAKAIREARTKLKGYKPRRPPIDRKRFRQKYLW
jgi:hypothetical protein